jgi:hypothetical protein
MILKTTTGLAAATLLAALLVPRSTSFHIVLEFVVCSAAALVVFEAVRAGKYLWALGFLLVFCIFNPILPVPAPMPVWVGIELLCLAAFAAAMVFVKHVPELAPVHVFQSEAAQADRS